MRIEDLDAVIEAAEYIQRGVATFYYGDEIGGSVEDRHCSQCDATLPRHQDTCPVPALTNLLARLREWRKNATEGYVDEVAEHSRDCSCPRGRTWVVSSDCGHIGEPRRPALLIITPREES